MLLEENSSSEGTPRSQKSQYSEPQEISRNTKAFIMVKLNVLDNKDANKTMLSTLRQMFKAIKTGCQTFVIYEYDKDDYKCAITSTEQIKGNLQHIRRFFKNVNPKEKKGDMWFNIYVGMDESIDELREGTNWWFKENKCLLLPKELQVRDSTTIVWFLFSHDKFDRKELCDKIKEIAKHVYNMPVNIALKNTAIKDGSVWKPNAKKFPVRAVHVEVTKEDAEKAKGVLEKMYGKNATNHPCGIRLQYVPNLDRTIPTHTKHNIISLKLKQEWYLASISYATSWDIATLTKETGEKKLSLRDMIMAIKSKTDAQLFRCVNIDTRGGGVQSYD